MIRIGLWKQELPWDTLNIMPKSPDLKKISFEDHKLTVMVMIMSQAGGLKKEQIQDLVILA